MGGEIGAKSTFGEGSEVTVKIPFKQGEVIAQPIIKESLISKNIIYIDGKLSQQEKFLSMCNSLGLNIQTSGLED